jgi:hypothetical protein
MKKKNAGLTAAARMLKLCFQKEPNVREFTSLQRVLLVMWISWKAFLNWMRHKIWIQNEKEIK